MSIREATKVGRSLCQTTVVRWSQTRLRRTLSNTDASADRQKPLGPVAVHITQGRLRGGRRWRVHRHGSPDCTRSPHQSHEDGPQTPPQCKSNAHQQALTNKTAAHLKDVALVRNLGSLVHAKSLQCTSIQAVLHLGSPLRTRLAHQRIVWHISNTSAILSPAPHMLAGTSRLRNASAIRWHVPPAALCICCDSGKASGKCTCKCFSHSVCTSSAHPRNRQKTFNSPTLHRGGCRGARK